MAFNTSLSGLNAAQSDLDVISNNVANSETVGFKNSRAEFADVFASSQLGVAQNAVGQGTRLQNVAQQFTQGQFDFTGNSLDLAINGEGFFRMSDEDGAISYTRNGAFQLDENGTVVNADGYQLTGFPADENGSIGGNLQPLQVNTGNIDPQATTEAEIGANLSSEAEVKTGGPVDPNDPETFNFSTSTTFFDSQGGAREANFYFTHTDDAANEWEVDLRVDGNQPSNANPRTLTFNDDGTFDSISDATPYEFPLAGVSDLEVDADFSNMTQFGTPSAVSSINQNGFEAGEFSSLEVAEDGTLFGRFTNGESQALGQVALARFPSEQNLKEQGDNLWTESADSGAPIIGEAGTSGLGGIEGGALEQSNVDITKELVNMITAQRNFQANSQMISTQDQVTQEVLNIR